MAKLTVEQARRHLKERVLDRIIATTRTVPTLDELIDALIAAVRAEQSPAIREALLVECTCRVIEKCLRCEAIDATLPS